MPWHVDIVILSNIPKDLGPGIEVFVHVPTKDPWSLPFGHRQLFADRADAYDVFIYSEDDTLVTQRNIEAFLDATRVLPPDEIAGFLRSEQDKAGGLYCVSMHSHFRWLPDSVRRVGADAYAQFTNEHAAVYMLTREHLKMAIRSGGFLVEPHKGRHDMLCAAATDPYTQCGFKKVVCISRINDFLLPHLPNKYVGRWGVPMADLDTALATLVSLHERGLASADGVLPVETKLPSARGSKDLYEYPDERFVSLIPTTCRRLLAIGSGWGATERHLLDRGHELVAIPADPVVAACAARRGVDVLCGPLDDIAGRLAGRQFDCIVAPMILHLLPDPVGLLRQFLGFLAPGGYFVASVPTFGDAGTWLRRIRGVANYRRIQDFQAVGTHRATKQQVRKWLEDCSLQLRKIEPVILGRRQKVSRALWNRCDGLLANEWLVQAVKGS
jgi:SAM-dependent methyltransferase